MKNRQFMFWAITCAVFIALVWLLKGVLAPFLAAGIIAYILQPLVTKLESLKLGRGLSTALSLALAFLLIALIIATIAPTLARQASQLTSTLPDLVETLKAKAAPYVALIQAQGLGDVKESLSSQGGAVTSALTNVLRRIFNSAMSVFDLLSLLLITPVVAFYLIRDWPKLTTQFHNLVPERAKPDIRWLTSRFDETLSSFFRGQALVCTLLGLFYAIGLSLVGLKYALLVGLFTGILSFIPFVGSLFGLVASVGIALYQFDGLTMPAIVAVIFATGQFLEGNVLTPRIVGDKVGLHAVWVIFALMAGSELFGFVGILLAVPVAALIGVLIRYGIKRYQNSPFYKSESAASS